MSTEPCTCTARPYDPDWVVQAEGERDPWCPTHLDLAHIHAERDVLAAKVARVEALLTDPSRWAGRRSNGDDWEVTHLHASDVRAALDGSDQ